MKLKDFLIKIKRDGYTKVDDFKKFEKEGEISNYSIKQFIKKATIKADYSFDLLEFEVNDNEVKNINYYKVL